LSLKKAIFLDRDGVINEDHEYVGQLERFHIYPFVGPALKLLKEKGFHFFIVTNQSGIGRGYFSEDEMHRVHDFLAEKMKEYDVNFTEIFFSPHHPDTPNDVRKPSPKFVLTAAEKYGIDLKNSFVIGDAATDLEMGYRAGCHVILVRTGKGVKTEKIQGVKFDHVFNNLLEAAEFISSSTS
jgi:D-glycero-D-manno-heptose 1,7-bisphosphate phosphatase